MPSYTPPSYNDANYTFNGTYYPNTIPYNSVNYTFGDLTVVIVNSNSVINILSDTKIITDADIIVSHNSLINIVSDTNLVIITLIENSLIQIFSDVGLVGGGSVTDLPSGLSTSFNGYSWGGKVGVDENNFSSYKKGFCADINIRNCTGEINRVENIWRICWSSYFKIDGSVSNPYRETVSLDKSIKKSWRIFQYADEFIRISTELSLIVDGNFKIVYQEPPPKDRTFTSEYIIGYFVTKNIFVPFRQPYPKDSTRRDCWGPFHYFGLCGIKYYPPIANKGVDFKFSVGNEIHIIPYDHANFFMSTSSTMFYCPYENNYSGPRDTHIPGVVIPTPESPIIKEVYYMLNTVLVKRLPDNVEIEVLGISAKIDEKSWLWQFNLIIGSRDYLDLIKPDILNANIFHDIDIYINGWRWTCRVESYSETRRFGKDAWSVVGRSPSMELGSPQNPVMSYVYDSGGTSQTAGSQIIDDILEGTMLGIDSLGWTADWSFYNSKVGPYSGFTPYNGDHWGIPANTFSWSNATQIDAIAQLTNSIGVYIQTTNNCYTDKRLIMKPLFSTPPWHWLTYSDPLFPEIDHILSESTFSDVGRQYQSNPSYNAVYVMGQKVTSAQKTNVTDGVVFVNAFRTGFAPTYQIHAPNVSSPWLTSWMACRESGRMTLSQAGEWMNHTIKLFSLAQFGTTGSGLNNLITPGEFLQVVEKGANWYGMVTGTTINANVVGNSAFHVDQTINVKQYMGN